jgi:hypothetical protein
MWRASRFPPPECLEARALPPKNGLGLNDLRRTDQPSLDAQSSSRPIEAGDRTQPDRIIASNNDDRNGRRSRLGGESRTVPPVATIRTT